MSLILPIIGAFGYVATGAVGLQSDDFNSTLSGFWTFTDPLSLSSTGATSGGNLEIAATDNNYDMYGATNAAPRVLQEGFGSDVGDFDIRTELTNNPTGQYQLQGFYVEDTGGANWLRADVYTNGTNIYAYASTNVGSTTTGRVSVSIGTDGSTFWEFIRLTRSTDTWSFYTSHDGSSWTQRGSSWSFSMDVRKVGLFAGTVGTAGAFTAQFNSFTVA